MIEIFVCEDQREQREKINQYIKNYIIIENLDMKLTMSTDSPNDIIDYVKNSSTNGLYFLDVDLNHDINGIALGAEIRKHDPHGHIVFITTHSELIYLTFMYKVAAMDYIIKDDFSSMKSRIISCIDTVNTRIKTDSKSSTKKFVKKVADKIISVNYSDIMFFESSVNLHKVVLHLDNRQIEFYGKLKDIEREHDSFIRAHNSYLVNLDNILEVDINSKTITMKNGELCYGSARRIKSVQKALYSR